LLISAAATIKYKANAIPKTPMLFPKINGILAVVKSITYFEVASKSFNGAIVGV
jgi:hypothetical protein